MDGRGNFGILLKHHSAVTIFVGKVARFRLICSVLCCLEEDSRTLRYINHCLGNWSFYLWQNSQVQTFPGLLKSFSRVNKVRYQITNINTYTWTSLCSFSILTDKCFPNDRRYKCFTLHQLLSVLFNSLSALNLLQNCFLHVSRICSNNQNTGKYNLVCWYKVVCSSYNLTECSLTTTGCLWSWKLMQVPGVAPCHCVTGLGPVLVYDSSLTQLYCTGLMSGTKNWFYEQI